MTQAAMTLWLAIDMLVTQIPFSKAKVESALLTQLSDTKAPGSEVFQFFEGTPVRFEDGVEASKFDLRIKREGAHPGFLVLEVQGRCVPLDEVKRHYADLAITDVPRGRSMNEATSYTATLGWGRLSFGFREKNPGCLAFIAFDPS
ncbi:hypothetical protein J2789_006854 [Variovorax paradoxus]|uniref:hypothetical protein n=1 Tax=Variovorax atrisoli TaxID=3394203 RepID=UPI0011993399|nr:hypothetical protein [Variovorax paradoxus]MDR6524151.1 hypothetical protein [Variovorax paradoxus]